MEAIFSRSTFRSRGKVRRDPLYVEVFQGQERAHTEDTQAKDWSVFFTDANGYGMVQHASDYSPVTRDNPAHAGEYLIAYGINLGPQGMKDGPQDTDTAVLGSVVNGPASGYPAPLNPLASWQAGPGACSVQESVIIGNVPAPEQFDGLAPGAVGVYQVNFQAPAGVSGDVPLAIERSFKYGVFGNARIAGSTTFTMGLPAGRCCCWCDKGGFKFGVTSSVELEPLDGSTQDHW